MANKIILKKTSTASKVPLSTDLEVGEIAVNLADQKLYSKNASGTVILVGQGVAGSGDVVGGSSSTDNALARYDGTTGKLIQNSTVTLDDNGNLANVNSVGFDTTPTTPPTTAGSMYWDSGNLTPTVVLNANTDLQLGQENIALVYNGTGSTITAGSVVAVSGAQGQRPSVSLADADSEALSAPTLGIATESIANGAEGFVTTFGFVRGINTSAFTAGAPIYLSQTAGQFTATRPSAPAHTVALGWVIKVNASSGEVFVNINNGWELDELHNVLITSPTSGNTLIYDSVAGVWKNANITGGTGLSVTNGAGTIPLANTGVTSVSGTAPISSSGGATPAISISQATTSTNGYLSSTDWNTFNSKATLPSQTGNAGKVLGTDGTNTSWVEGGGGASAFFTRYNFTATASQTTFAVGVTLTLIEVYNNGARLIPTTDYSISGTNVVLASGASVGSIITVLVYTTFDVANTYTQSQTDSLLANKANTNGSNATGTWGISISGNSATSSNTSSISSAVGNGYTWTGVQQFQSNLGTTSGSLSNPSLQAYATGTNSAFMSFHRSGSYAINMGLDSDNVLRIGGWSASANRFQMDMSGNLTMAGNVTAYSDETLKKDWDNLTDNFVTKLASVKYGTYTRIDTNERQVGVSAQSLKNVLPESVNTDKDGILSVAYGNASLVSCIELAKEIQLLKKEIALLKAK